MVAATVFSIVFVATAALTPTKPETATLAAIDTIFAVSPTVASASSRQSIRFVTISPGTAMAAIYPVRLVGALSEAERLMFP